MIVAIIQARMGSSRLPGKVLLPFGKTTVLGYLIDRLRQSLLIEKLIVATTLEAVDDEIALFAQSRSCDVYRGETDNVLERYYFAAQTFQADIIVRITADDPFKCSDVIDDAITLLRENDYDYVSNTLTPTYPEGIDVEVFTYSTLENARKKAYLFRHKEHVTAYIYEHPEEFKLGHLVAEQDRSNWRMTIDYPRDYRVLKDISDIVDPGISYNKLAEFVLNQNLVEITNPTTCRNEAYNEQLRE